MSAPYATGIAVQAFFEYISNVDIERNRQKYSSVFDLLEEWVTDGHGTRDCSDDFQIYLQVIIVIIQIWHDDDGIPGSLISKVADTEKPQYHILDPGFFQYHKVTLHEKELERLHARITQSRKA